MCVQCMPRGRQQLGAAGWRTGGRRAWDVMYGCQRKSQEECGCGAGRVTGWHSSAHHGTQLSCASAAAAGARAGGGVGDGR